jgi:cysteine dioxygenase
MTIRPEVSVDDLVRHVRASLEAGRPDEVTTYLGTRRIGDGSLAPYLHRSESHYTRNLVYRDEVFELLVLCWGVGHRAWIHNHRGQRCWMAVTDGVLRVRNYRRLGCDQVARTVRLVPTGEVRLTPGGLATVDPAEPVHAVWNPPEAGRPAVSVHVYSRSFDTCVSYDTEAGVCRDVRMFYTSQHGARLDPPQDGRRLDERPPSVCTLAPAERDAHCGALPIARDAVGTG